MSDQHDLKQPSQKKELSPKTELRLAKTTLQVGSALKSGKPEKAIQQALFAGLKMASDESVDRAFKNELVNPLKLAQALKKIGIATLAWAPETLIATLDQKYSNWDWAKASEALEYFHKTGVIKSDIPQLVREKIYAIRVVATSNSAQTEWHIFEKVGGAFNDRVVKFGVVEPLSAAECARTVAIIENIRPDTYTKEIKIYIAACCHEAGLLTVEPVKWLAMAEPYLQQMNLESSGRVTDPETKLEITKRFNAIRLNPHLNEVPDDLISVQAAKLAAIDLYAEEIVHG